MEIKDSISGDPHAHSRTKVPDLCVDPCAGAQRSATAGVCLSWEACVHNPSAEAQQPHSPLPSPNVYLQLIFMDPNSSDPARGDHACLFSQKVCRKK